MKLYKFSIVYAIRNPETFDFSDMLKNEIYEGFVHAEPVTSIDDLPPGWDVDCTPFGQSNDLCIEEILSGDYEEKDIIEVNGVKYKRMD